MKTPKNYSKFENFIRDHDGFKRLIGVEYSREMEFIPLTKQLFLPSYIRDTDSNPFICKVLPLFISSPGHLKLPFYLSKDGKTVTIYYATTPKGFPITFQNLPKLMSQIELRSKEDIIPVNSSSSMDDHIQQFRLEYLHTRTPWVIFKQISMDVTLSLRDFTYDSTSIGAPNFQENKSRMPFNPSKLWHNDFYPDPTATYEDFFLWLKATMERAEPYFKRMGPGK